MGFFDLGLGPIADVMKDLIQLFPTAEQRAAAANKIQDAQEAIAAQQSATNTAEAANTSIFVSGWRPFIGWVCGAGFVYSIVQPVLHLPPVDMSNIVAILGGMLGLGTMRTVEKLNNVPPTIRRK
jgi:Holin of 3TMs, for gene-transfer release